MAPIRIALFCLLAGSTLAHPALAGDQATALYMVKNLQLGDGLGALGLQAATQTTTFQVISKAVGPDKARALVSDELKAARPRYQDIWERNLAAAYARSFSNEELRSIADRRQQSPYFNKFKARQSEVGVGMQSSSSGVLSEYVTEAIAAAHRKAIPTK